MTRFSITLVVLWWWCCWWSFFLQPGVECATDEMEDFPLDADANANDHHTAVGFSTLDHRNSSSDSNDKSVAADDRIVTFNKIMTMAMKEPTVKRNLGQVLPIIRAMSPTQRLTLATLVLKQLTSASPPPSSSSSSSPNSLPHLEQFSNKSAELMLPISADIATMLQSLKKNAESGRSTVFGTYYYNPLSAGYRVNSGAQRPIMYNIRRRFQASANNRKTTDDVPPEMMPPPFVPSSNVSYANFNEKKQSSEDDNDDETENENAVHESEEQEEYDSETAANGVDAGSEQCVTFNDYICYDETDSSYPSEHIVNSIKNLEQKRVFGALVQDFIHNATAEETPEIQRRLGSATTPTAENALQLCASKIKYARPKKAKSTTGSWKYIVNTDHYTQTVRIETCLNADKSCSFLNENVKSQCVQIYNYHRLLTWDEKSGLSLDLFKIPTCCSCQIQQANAFAQLNKHSKKPSDVELKNNAIVDQSSNVVYTPATKPKTKHKFNLTPLSSAPYNTLKRESASATKARRPLQPVILPLQHLDGGGGGGGVRYSTSDNAIRRTSSKTNILKGVYVPSKGTLTEYTTDAAPESNSNGGGGGGGGDGSMFPRRVNYNYHPIIDFFRSTPATQAADRADTVIDEWLPMTEGPRSMKTR